MIKPAIHRFRLFLRDLSLPRKVLFPFFLILLLLGTSATVGAILLLKESNYETIDGRLQTLHESILKELSTHQEMLKIFARLIAEGNEDFFARDGQQEQPLFTYSNIDEAVDFTIRYVPIAEFAAEKNPVTQMALNDAIVDETPVNAVLHSKDDRPVLAIIAPVGPPDEPRGAVIVHNSIDASFLAHLPSPDEGSISLFSPKGRLLSTTASDIQLRQLDGDELLSLSRGKRVLETISPPFGHRVLYNAIPLGKNKLILAIAQPMDDLKSLITVLASRSLLSIVAALMLGGIVYALIIRSIMAPVKKLLAATAAVSEGNLDHRIPFTGNDEFGRLAHSFNHMLTQLGRLYDERIEHQKKLAFATGELQHKKDIERKNAEIADTNRNLQATIAELSALFQCNQAMISTLDLNLLFDRILSVLKDVMNCDHLVLLIYDQEDEILTVRKVLGLDQQLMDNLCFHLNDGITGEAAREKKTVYVEDLSADERNLCYKGGVQIAGSLISVPMVMHERLIGVLNLHKEAQRAFGDSEKELARAIANQAAIAIENARLYEQTRTLSITDELTSLANRRHFWELLEREKRQADRFKGHFSIIMLDIDHFKSYNDAHGHMSGDVALKQLADILLENTRGVDLVARYGGEEFVVLLSQTDRRGAVHAAEKIRTAVEAMPFRGEKASQPEGTVTVSLGVATYPEHGSDLEELINRADMALYRAKGRGRNCIGTPPDGKKPPAGDFTS